MMTLLTTEKIRKTKPSNKRITLRDGFGLYLRIQPSDIRSWVLRLNINGRNCDLTLGHWPDVSLKMARQLARRKRKEFELTPPKGYTLNDAFTLWCSIKSGNIVSYRGEKGRIKKYIISKIGNKQIDEITAPMIIGTLKHLHDSGKRATLKRCILRLREILDLAVCAGFIQHNPCPKLTMIFPAPIVTPMPSLPWQGLIRILMEVFKSNNSRYENLFLLSLCLLLRPKEIVSLRWDWINGDILTIPAEVMKMRRPHRVPLTNYSLKLLNKIKQESKHKRSAFIFPSIKSNKHINAQTLAKYMRETPAFKNKIVPHGLRSIGRSWVADNDVDFIIAESCLAHVFGNQVSRAYLRSDLLDARRKVIEQWNVYIEDCAQCARNLQICSIKLIGYDKNRHTS